MPIIDPATAAVALDGPLTVAAGRTAHHRLAVTNLAPHPLVLQTNGRITAPVLDPESGRLVGIATEAQTLPEISFEAAPGTTVKVPLLVGTASVDPRLGFTVPAGHWDAQAELSIAGERFLTPPLPMTVGPTLGIDVGGPSPDLT